MVLLEIDAAGLAIFELEGYAPRPIDMDRIAFWIESLQRVKVEARDVHFLGSDGDVEAVEPCKNAPVHFRIYLRPLALGPQFRKGLALKSSDHD